MQLAFTRNVGAVRPACRRTATPIGLPRIASMRPATSSAHQRKIFVAKAAEETQATTETAEPTVEAEPELELSSIERAKKALESESVDKDVLASCLAGLESDMASMRASVTAAEERSGTLEAAVSSAKDQYLRLNADFDNFRRRTREDKEQLTDSVRGDVIKDLLPLVDNFELARTQVKAETEAEQKINNSYQSLYKQMVEIMRSLGVEAVPTVGSPFDPNMHEAIMREPSTEHPDGTVLMEFRKGFRIGDKLLRPAMVQVSFNDEPPVSGSEE